MPKIRSTRPCKYCNSPRRLNVVDGRNKGFLRTCGSDSCLTAHRRDPDVRRKKGHLKVSRIVKCKICNSGFISRHNQSLWCKACVPTSKWRHMARRYGLGEPQYKALAADGRCQICDGLGAAIDHDHSTGAVRGFLCSGCNYRLGVLEDDSWVTKAFAYLRKGAANAVPL